MIAKEQFDSQSEEVDTILYNIFLYIQKLRELDSDWPADYCISEIKSMIPDYIKAKTKEAELYMNFLLEKNKI
jgi:hypothetical protein